MKILITGAKGQLGQDCAKVLGAENTVHGYSSRQLDITDKKKVLETFQSLRPDIVVNCAAYTAVDKCETDTERCWQVNAEGSGIIASASSGIGVRMFHISTDYVFDGSKPESEPYIEDDPVHPLSEYGASKLAGEEQVRKYLPNHIILRTSWLYGIGGPNFLKTMLRLAVNNPGQTLKVVDDQFGSFTWSYRVALQIKELLHTDVTGTFHVTAEGRTTWYEGAKLFLDTMQVPFSLEPCPTTDYPTPARRPTNSILENYRLKTKNLNRMVPWDEDIIRFATTFRKELLAGLAG